MRYKSYLYPLLIIALLIEASAAPIIVAHRGASKLAPENTIAAFELAWDQGADAIEGDFLLTADGEIVCIHDKNTKRVAKSNFTVEDSTLNELLQLDVGAWMGNKWSETRIPTISQVFATIPSDKLIYIEIKCGSEIISKLFEELRNPRMAILNLQLRQRSRH
jgi:glycerophosphoryl diester phosphodiesterase